MTAEPLPFGSDDLRLPDPLRAPLRAHLAALREQYRRLGWGGPVGAPRPRGQNVARLA